MPSGESLLAGPCPDVTRLALTVGPGARTTPNTEPHPEHPESSGYLCFQFDVLAKVLAVADPVRHVQLFCNLFLGLCYLTFALSRGEGMCSQQGGWGG